MKVHELIKRLGEYDPNLEVVVASTDSVFTDTAVYEVTEITTDHASLNVVVIESGDQT